MSSTRPPGWGVSREALVDGLETGLRECGDLAADLPLGTCCDTFRATGITACPSNGGLTRARQAVLRAPTGLRSPGATLQVVRRLALTVLVALLTISASGLSSLVVAEPCATASTADHDDATCPPTCVTCGCCAQAAKPVILTLTPAPRERLTAIVAPSPHLPRALPHDILHVPKRPSA